MGLYDAKLDHAPVVAIVGQSARTAIGGSYQQEVDLQSLFKDVAHEYVHTCMTAESLPLLIDRAVRIAKAERCVTCVIVPKDVQELDAVPQTPHEHDFVPLSAQLRRAADLLNTGEKVALLAFGMSLLKMDSEEGGIIKQAIHQLFPSTGTES